MATLNQVQLSNSTLKSKTIHKSKLTKCTLIRITFHNSSVTDSVLKNCSVYDSIIRTSKLYNCKIYGTQGILRCELDGCKLLPAQPTLSKFPAEIREIIFKLCLAETWTGKTPSLIIALRCQKELYSQALEVFQKTNRFFLRDANRLVLFKSMPETVLSNIRSITIANLFM
ncbi:hypothetical protein V8E51_004801 [Hyaloscypha variabilis]